MNREIKFRGKRADNDEWTYGYLVYSEDYMFDSEKEVIGNIYESDISS